VIDALTFYHGASCSDGKGLECMLGVTPSERTKNLLSFGVVFILGYRAYFEEFIELLETFRNGW
jgi:hypothetical protein